MPDTVAARLVAFLREGDDDGTRAAVDEDTSLLRSGLLDSLGLFRLLEWIEHEVGAPVEVAAVDILAEWDTPLDVAVFVSRSRDSAAPAPASESRPSAKRIAGRS
jgi:hypothetical protein